MTRLPVAEVEQRLREGEVSVLGQVQGSSNVVLVVEVDGLRAVHKPVAGEAPLWDFPEGTLALRERATWLLAQVLQWPVVPVTVLRDGPWGSGSFQSWVESDDEDVFVDVVPHGTARTGWRHVLSGEDGEGNAVDVIHRDTPELRRMALLDAVANNSDRKGGHILAGADGHPVGIDHGLTFHPEPKLRTVLWGWVGEPLSEVEVVALTRLVSLLDTGSPPPEVAELRELLSSDEYRATTERARSLVASGTFPAPDGRWPSVPWPPF